MAYPAVGKRGMQFDRQVYGIELKVASTRSRPISDTHRDETAAAKLTVAPAQPAPHELQRDITRYVVPSRQGVFSFSATCPAALVCTRSLASAGRVM